MLGKKAKVICINEVLIFYPLLAAAVGIREKLPNGMTLEGIYGRLIQGESGIKLRELMHSLNILGWDEHDEHMSPGLFPISGLADTPLPLQVVRPLSQLNNQNKPA